MSTIIHVTEEHIKNGIPGSICDCAIGLALKPYIPYPIEIRNSYWVTYITDIRRHLGYGIALPKEARDFIHQFDNKRKVKPFSFPIELPK